MAVRRLFLCKIENMAEKPPTGARRQWSIRILGPARALSEQPQWFSEEPLEDVNGVAGLQRKSLGAAISSTKPLTRRVMRNVFSLARSV